MAFGGIPRMSTNHLGRQRPPSWQPSDELRGRGNGRVDDSHSNRNRAPSPRSSSREKHYDNNGGTISVSLSEFDIWVQRNKDWKAGVTAKVTLPKCVVLLLLLM